MPRPPKKNHPLRELRKIIGYSQERLAEELGVATITVKRMEAGAAIPDRIAALLAERFAVEPISLIDGEEALTDLFQNPYHAGSRTAWRSLSELAEPDDCMAFGRMIGLTIAATLMNARLQRRLMEAKVAVELAVFDIQNTFMVTEDAMPMSTTFKKLTSRSLSASTTVAKYLDSPLGVMHLTGYFGEMTEDSSRWKPDEIIEIKGQTWYMPEPHDTFGNAAVDIRNLDPNLLGSRFASYMIGIDVVAQKGATKWPIQFNYSACDSFISRRRKKSDRPDVPDMEPVDMVNKWCNGAFSPITETPKPKPKK